MFLSRAILFRQFLLIQELHSSRRHSKHCFLVCASSVLSQMSRTSAHTCDCVARRFREHGGASPCGSKQCLTEANGVVCLAGFSLRCFLAVRSTHASSQLDLEVGTRSTNHETIILTSPTLGRTRGETTTNRSRLALCPKYLCFVLGDEALQVEKASKDLLAHFPRRFATG